MSRFIFKNNKNVMKLLPKNTKLKTYFEYHSSNVRAHGTFCLTNIPDGRILLTIVHCWDDGEIMEVGGYDFGEGFQRGFNPLHIVRIYDKQMSRRTMERDLDRFLKRYYKKETHTCESCNCDSKGSCSR